jgi:hypothetical protein
MPYILRVDISSCVFYAWVMAIPCSLMPET